MQTEIIKLHDNRVLWPSQKSLEEVLEIKRTNPEHIWETTWQGNPVSPKGKVFKREWFVNRFTDFQRPVLRAISLDTALSDQETAAMSAAVIVEITPSYHMRVVDAIADHMNFPTLVQFTRDLAVRYNQDKLIHYIIIEKKVSGFSLIQTLEQSSEGWVKNAVVGYQPKVDKNLRYQQASVWCANGMVQLPAPDDDNYWLYDFEDDLFNAPDIPFKDRVDAFAQAVLYFETWLAEGYRAIQGRK